MQRFWAKVEKRGDNECWLWTGCVGADGYGHFRLDGKVVSAHRVSFQLEHGREPQSHVLHGCDTPLCCNPKHLSEGTHNENMRECSDRKRNRTSRPGNGHRRLSDQDYATIRARYRAGSTNKSALAREFSVTPTRIRQIVNGV